VCTSSWNEAQDAGRPWAEGVRLLQAEHPAFAELIARFDTEWEKTLKGPIEASVALLQELKARRVPLYALSNWSHEKFPFAQRRFAFLELFDGMVISGHVKVAKPDPRIYQHLTARFGLRPETTLFVDDSERNVQGALAVGFHAVRFESPAQLRTTLQGYGLLGGT
jgi:2-haloacid dehalogenase